MLRFDSQKRSNDCKLFLSEVDVFAVVVATYEVLESAMLSSWVSGPSSISKALFPPAALKLFMKALRIVLWDFRQGRCTLAIWTLRSAKFAGNF